MNTEHYYRHIKTGKIYRKFLLEIVDATNTTDGRQMILYQNSNGDMFVREQEEFNAKFDLIDDQQRAMLYFKHS